MVGVNQARKRLQFKRGYDTDNGSTEDELEVPARMQIVRLRFKEKKKK